MSSELYMQHFMQGGELKYKNNIMKSNSINEKLQAIESLIYLHKYDEAKSELTLIEQSGSSIKQDQKILLLLLKALSFTETSDKENALSFVAEAEDIILKIKNSTIALNQEFIIFLFSKAKVLYNFQILDEALKIFKQCFKEAFESNNKFYQVRSLNRIARIYIDKELFELALEQIMKALAISTANRFYYEIFLGYEMLGTINQTKNKDQSLKYFDSCLKIAMNDLQNDILIAKALMNIGRTKLLQKDLDQAHHHWLEALNLYYKTGYSTYVPLVLKYLGDLFVRKGNYSEALKNYKESLQLNQRQTISGMTLFAMGSTYFRIRDFKNALKYYSESLDLKRSIGNKIDLAGPLWGIGHVHFIKQNYNKSLKFYTELYEIYKEFGRPEYISEILLIIITLEDEVGDEVSCKKYLDLLENLSLDSSSTHIMLSLSIAQALATKDMRFTSLLERLELFTKTLSNLSINQHFSYFSLLNITLLYLQEFIATQQDVVLTDLRNTITTLRELAIINYSYPLELFAIALTIQLNYIQNTKEENNSLVVKLTSIIDTIQIDSIEKELNKILAKIDRLEKDMKKSTKNYTKTDIITKLGVEKFVKKIIKDKYWL